MYIRSLHLKNFKRFEKLDLEFPGDVTVVKGPNEQGKSTVVEALIAVLFYDPKKSNKKLESFRAWGSEAWYVLRCVFEEGGEIYELVKDFGAKTVSLVNTNTGELWKDTKEIEEMMWQFGGYRNEKLFTSTAFIKQDAVGEIASGKKELSQALEDMVSAAAGGVSVSDIIKRIDARLEEAMRGIERPSKTPGRMKELEDRYNEMSAALRDARKKTLSIEEKLRMAKEKEALLEGAARDLELKEGEAEDMRNYFSFEVRRKETEPRIEEFSDDIELIEKLDVAYRELERELKSYPVRESDLKDIYRFSKEIEMGESRLLDLKKMMASSYKGRRRDARRLLSSRSLSLAGSLGLFFAGLAGFFLVPRLYAIGWILITLSLILGTFALLRFSRPKRSEVSREIAAWERKLVSLGKSFAPILKRLGARNVEEAEERLGHLKEVRSKIQQLSSKREGILRGKSLEEKKKDKRELERVLALENAKVPQELFAHPPSYEEMKKVERAVRILQEKKKELSEAHAVLKGEIDILAARPEEIPKLEEGLSATEGELRRLKRRVAVYRLLKDSLLEAKVRAVKGIKGTLENFMKEFIVDITLGRYADLRVGEDLTLEVYSPEKGEIVNPHETLSQGTVDQLYLVARFAFLKILTGAFSLSQKSIIPARPLVVLDDPFHTFDNERRARAKELIKRLSHEFQIILFTHSDEYDSWGITQTLEGKTIVAKTA